MIYISCIVSYSMSRPSRETRDIWELKLNLIQNYESKQKKIVDKEIKKMERIRNIRRGIESLLDK